jgi:hypothetical protein
VHVDVWWPDHVRVVHGALHTLESAYPVILFGGTQLVVCSSELAHPFAQPLSAFTLNAKSSFTVHPQALEQLHGAWYGYCSFLDVENSPTSQISPVVGRFIPFPNVIGGIGKNEKFVALFGVARMGPMGRPMVPGR